MNEKRLGRLTPAIDWSIKQMQFPRNERFNAFQQFCGSHYAEGGAGKKVPVNFLALAVMIFMRRLAANAPEASMSSDDVSLRPLASDFAAALNLIPGEIGLVTTLRKWVVEAMFSPWGVIKCGLEKGNVFADLVTLDDYFIDMSAASERTIDFEGNDYWMDFDDIMEDKRYVNKDRLTADERTPLGPNGETRVQGISVSGTMTTYKKKKWCRDVWMPDEGLLVTYTVQDKRVIREVDLDELRHSPYHRLSYNSVPGQLMPLPTVSLWRDLHDLGNSLFRTLANGADSQKTVLGFSGDEEGVRAFQGAMNGDGINYHGQDPRALKAGGIEPQTLMFFLQCRDLMSYFAGNLDSLGGLGAQADTAAQDKLISGAANAQLNDMSEITTTATEDLYRSIAYYEYTDPTKKRILQKKIPGVDFTIPVEFGPSQRQNADFGAFYIKLDVHSMAKDSPSQKLAKLKGFVQELIIPLEPFISNAGGTVDVKAILRRAGEYAQFPEADEFVVFVDLPQARAASGGVGGRQANTTHTSTQQRIPAQSTQGNTQKMMSALAEMSNNQ